MGNEVKNGIVNRGYDYENRVPAFLALKLLFHDDSISDFSLTLNPSSYRKFDDLRIDVEYRDGKKLSYLFQLKHRERGKEKQNASILESGNNKRFDLQEYLKSYKKITEYGQEKTCFIFTNIQFSDLDKLQRYKVSIINNVKMNIFDTSTSLHPNSIHKFEDRTTEVSDKFYDNFFLLSNQKDVPDLQESIIKMFKEKYDAHERTAKLYIYFFQELRLEKHNTDNIVTKNDIVLQILKLLLKKSVVVGCATTEYDENVKLIQKIFQQFDVTLLDEWDEDLIPNDCLSNQELRDEEQIWFVRVDEISKTLIVSIIHLCKKNKLKIKFVLLGRVDISKDFPECKSFKNLNNLKERNPILYKEFASKAKLSLQGRKETSLEELATRYNLHLQHFLTPNEIFKLIKGNLIIGEKLKEKPEPYISRLLLDEDSNKVKDSAITFENQLNVICGKPGYGKTTLMKYLSNNCPEDHWVVNINAKEFCWVFKNKCELKTILQDLFYQENHQDFKEIFQKEAKIIFFFDALDELNSDCQKRAYEIIKELAKQNLKIWMFLRCDLTSVPQFDMKVSIYKMKDFDEKSQEKYVKERLKDANNAQEKIKEFGKVKNRNAELKELLKVPLYLFIITEILKENNDYTQQIRNISNLYDYFIKGRIKHYLAKNGKKIDEVWKDEFQEFLEYYLEQYQIAALQSCLEPGLFKRLPVSNNKKFIHTIKASGDTLGIIRNIANDTFVFHHHTYGEYLTASWLVENFDNIPVNKRKFILQEKYSNIKQFCDLKFAEKFPLDSVTLYCYAATVDRFDLLEKAIAEGPYDNKQLFETFLQLAVKDGFKNLLEFLINHGANTGNVNGKMLLHEAIRNGHHEVVAFWLNYRRELLETRDPMGAAPLHLAAVMNHPKIIQILYEHGADINAVDNFKRTPLHYASYAGRFAAVNILVTKGAKIDEKDENEITSLHEAAEKGHIKIVRYLVTKNADVNITDRYKWTPLHFAANSNHLAIVKYLVKKMEHTAECTDEDGKTAMNIATDRGFHDIVQFFKDIKRDLPRKINTDYTNTLHGAAEAGDLDQIKSLLASGANINGIDKNDNDRNTILHIAAYHGYQHIVDFLLDSNAKTSIKNHYGRIPLHLAAQMGHLGVIKSLTEKNIEDLKVSDRWELLPLHRASYKGHIEIIEFFLDKGVDVNSPGLKGGTALHSAARGGRINVMKYLIDKGANLKAKDKTMKTCLHLAAQEGRVEAVKYLLKQDISLLDEVDIIRRTALHRAVEIGNLDLVKCLVGGGANIDICNENDQTALDIAKTKKKNQSIIDYLQENK